MAITAYKTFANGEVLYAADLNASFSQIINNPIDLWSPMTKNAAAGGFKLTGLGVGGASGEALTYGQALVGTTLALTGATTGGTTAVYSGAVTVGSLASSGAVSGTTGTFSGALSGTTLTLTGATTGGTTAAYSGAVTVASLASSGAVSGTTGTFTGAVSGTNATFTGNANIGDHATNDSFNVTAVSSFTGNSSFNDGVTLGGDSSDTIAFVGTPIGNILSTTYTPTITNVSNMDANTLRSAYYTRVGTQILVFLRVNMDPTAADTSTSVGVSLPVASNFSTAFQAIGSGSSAAGSRNCLVSSDSGNDRATYEFTSDSVASTADHAIWFMYQVI